MEKGFKEWLADKEASYGHIKEYFKRAPEAKRKVSIMKKYGMDFDDLVSDCWIYIWEKDYACCKTVRGYYNDNLVLGWDEERKLRKSIQVAAWYYLLENCSNAFDKSAAMKEIISSGELAKNMEDWMVKSKGVITADWTKDEKEKVLVLWASGEMADEMAMDLLGITSRKTLYNRWEELAGRLKDSMSAKIISSIEK
jgi:hypothetical protein